jgi:SAM-dependent methyltransferase
LAKARTAETVPGARIVAGVGQALPVADGWADAVAFVNSLHHIPTPVMPAALAEAARVLKPGGVVYVSEPLAEGPFFEAVLPIDDETAVRAAALAAIKGAALRPVSEFFYVNTVRMDSYEAFRERIVSANAEREAAFARLDGEMRERFLRLAQRGADGFVFEQPMRINLLGR